MMWATAQALVTLPVSLLGYAAACLWLHVQQPGFAQPFGPRPAVFIGLMFTIAILCSWVGAMCWNVASQRLPTVIVGPLIVFETLAGLLYTFMLRQQMPPWLTLSGIALLVCGVVMAVRAKPENLWFSPFQTTANRGLVYLAPKGVYHRIKDAFKMHVIISDEVTAMAFRDQPLGELALSIPRASALFRKYDMDYCCGGKQTLERAASRKELDVGIIEAELAKLADQPIEKDWRVTALSEIMDHIIVRYHDRHREQLPELILQATKVERVHADKPNVPKGLTKYLTMLHDELSSHMMKEERILFPMIKEGMGSQAKGPISVMESEHDDAGELLDVIKHITNGVTPPPEACTTWKAMYNGINELIDDLMEHISLENNVLFPRALAGN